MDDDLQRTHLLQHPRPVAQAFIRELLFAGQPVDRDLAREHGVTGDRLRALVQLGLLRQVLRGVYVDTDAVDDETTRARCLALRLPPGAAVSRLTAAWLYGIDGRMPEQRSGPVEVECTVPLGIEPLSRPGVRCYVAPLTDDVHLVDGVPCTSPERTAVDVLRWLPPQMGLAVVDAMAARNLVRVEALPSAVERFRAARGARQARYLAGVVEPLTESFGESWARGYA